MTPERTKDTGYWNDDFVQGLPPLGKLLFDYLWTNSDCNQAGLYHITLRTMAFDTGIPEDELPDILHLLDKKVKWWPELNLVWVKNFLKRQIKSPTFLVAVAKCLDKINFPEIINEFLDYNLNRYNLIIPYEERHQVFEAKSELPKAKATLSVEKDTLLIPTPFEMELLEVIKTFPGWQYQENEDLAWLRALTADYPNATVENLKACGDYFSDKKEVTKGAFKNRIRQWLKRDKDFGKESKGGAHPRSPKPLDTTDPKRYKGQKYDHMVKR